MFPEIYASRKMQLVFFFLPPLQPISFQGLSSVSFVLRVGNLLGWLLKYLEHHCILMMMTRSNHWGLIRMHSTNQDCSYLPAFFWSHRNVTDSAGEKHKWNNRLKDIYNCNTSMGGFISFISLHYCAAANTRCLDYHCLEFPSFKMFSDLCRFILFLCLYCAFLSYFHLLWPDGEAHAVILILRTSSLSYL